MRQLVALVLCALVTGCGGYAGKPAAVAAPPPIPVDWSVEDPGPPPAEPLRPDLLVLGTDTLPEPLVDEVFAVRGVRGSLRLSVASVAVAHQTITVAGADLAPYRRFAAKVTAESEPVWRALAAGEAVITHEIGRDLSQDLGGELALRDQSQDFRLRIGAYASTVPTIDALVNVRRAEQLGMAPGNAILLSVDSMDVRKAVERITGETASVQPLVEPARGGGGERQAAYLTGGSVAKAVGSFSYRYFPDGSVQPDARWVSANIRTETVPLLGRVTCHRRMLSQLRGALTEIERAGLGALVHPGEYGGCYVPRFIGRDPRRGLSLHTWGIAVDLNVPGNMPGTAGQIDRRVVAVFKKWGFSWGGDWRQPSTDPMHLELSALVET